MVLQPLERFRIVPIPYFVSICLSLLNFAWSICQISSLSSSVNMSKKYQNVNKNSTKLFLMEFKNLLSMQIKFLILQKLLLFTITKVRRLFYHFPTSPAKNQHFPPLKQDKRMNVYSFYYTSLSSPTNLISVLNTFWHSC